jgi:hypothetical protein
VLAKGRYLQAIGGITHGVERAAKEQPNDTTKLLFGFGTYQKSSAILAGVKKNVFCSGISS